VIGNHDYKDIALYYGIDVIVPAAYINIGGIDFKLSHYPYQDSMTAHDVVKRPECFTNGEINKKTKELYPLICGHVHDEFAVKNRCLNVGWDIWGYPLTEFNILEIYNLTDGFKRECKNAYDVYN
jgi:calcineurin-like phosphoesterase family protein